MSQMKVKEGRTELTVVHNGEDLTFIHPYFGSDTYANVGDQITAVKEIKLRTPTMAQTASLVNTAFNSDDRYSEEIKQLMKDSGLWAFTGILYVPGEGAYIQDYPEVKEGKPYMEKSDLVSKLEKKDPSVRFAPFGFKINEMTPKELAKNKFVIALAGEEGADKLAEVAGKHNINPYLWSFESVDKLETKVSALCSGRGSGRLVVGGDRGDWNGFAFGYAPKKSP